MAERSKFAKTSPNEPPSVPAGCLAYAIGDIHGRADLLERLLVRIADDAAGQAAERPLLVFLGDYVDRGTDSRRVVDLVLHGVPAGFSAVRLKGNHEQLLLDFLADPARLPLWLANGGDATMASYGLDVAELDARSSAPALWRRRFLSLLPTEHRRFFETLELTALLGDYFFVHAGVRPGVALDRQSAHDFLWIRDEFLSSGVDFGKVVVHGHTPGEAPVVRANRIGIDTLAWASGRLTALRLRGTERAFLTTE